jgi:sugar phosphate isomerase/epimerase
MFAEGAERSRLLQVFDEACGQAAALQCTTVMSPVDPGKGDVQRAAASIREVGDIAKRHGVRLALEANSQCEQYNTLEKVCEALSLAAHPNCGFLLDAYHLQRSGGSVAGLKEIVYFQFSDVPRQGLVPGKSLDRLPAGQGCVPFPEIIAALKRMRYDGYLSYEAPNPASWAQDPTVVAKEALQAARALL